MIWATTPPRVGDVTGVAGGSLVSSNSFFGGATLSGNLVQGNGGIIGAGGNGTVGTLSISGNLTLNAGSLAVDLGNSASSGNDSIIVSGSLTANATNDVNLTALAGGFDTANAYTLITAGSVVGDQTHYRAAGPLALSRYTFTFDTSSGKFRADMHARGRRRGKLLTGVSATASGQIFVERPGCRKLE